MIIAQDGRFGGWSLSMQDGVLNHRVQIDLGDDDHDHFIGPDERLRIAMARH